MINTVVLSREELSNIIYSKGDPYNLDKKIKYFYYTDVHSPHSFPAVKLYEPRIFFVTLFDDKEIIGLCKLEESPYNQQGLFWIDYISIIEEFQGQGYVKNIVETMMKFCKNNNFRLETSGYSKIGWKKVRGLLHDYAKKYDVELIDKRDKPQYESFVKFSDFKVNEEYDHIKETILKFIKDKNLYLMNDKYLELFHGTDPATHRKIEKSGVLKSGTWFGIDYETSRRYGLMRIKRGEPVVMRIYVDIDSLYISGEYFIAKHDLKMNLMYGSGSNVYENKNDVSFSSFQNYINKDDNNKLNKKLIKTYKDGDETVIINAVNGQSVRNNGFVEWVDGGHYFVDAYLKKENQKYAKFFPKDEIWIDDIFLVKPSDMYGIIFHEMIERFLMKNYDFKYEPAHNIANTSEEYYRKNCPYDNPEKIVDTLYNNFIRNYKEKETKTINKDNIKYYICENFVELPDVIKKFNENYNPKEEMFIPEDILEFHDLFSHAGKTLFIVGGAVRDYIMGKTPHDYDLVTNALPDETKHILKDYRTDPQGAHFGIIRVYTEDEPMGYEIAAYRKDISKGRNTKGDDQKVEIGSHITIEDDVKRRDLTINALFYDIDNKKVIDLVGGIEDIKNGVIKAVGNPKERFNEDRLRMLRTMRFAARSHGTIDKETAKAIHEDNRLNGLLPEENVSQERILEEIWKMWEYSSGKNDLPAWKMYLRYLTGFKMWNQMFKNTLINEDVIDIDSLDLIQMYAYLFLENTPDANFNKRLVREFKFSSDYADTICFLITFYNNIGDIEKVFDMKKKQKQFDIDPSIIKEFSEIHNIDKKFTDKFIEYDLSVSGQELIDSGLKGDEIGIEQRKQEKEIFQNMLSESFDF